MEFPNAEDYIRAVQHPALAFNRPELARARFELHPLLRIPMPSSGTTAVVFKATVGGVNQALRFFTREDASTRQRYTALNAYFAERGLCPHVATCQWVDDAITVNGRKWPMVQMEWVDGHTLDQHVEDLVAANDTAALRSLTVEWRELLRNMQAARFAHGDLQHGNVLVGHNGALRLVDFDGAWIEPFAGSKPPTESGHRNYQHPASTWGPWMDTFPGLVVYLSLLVLSRSPKQWNHLYNGENLLFSRPDFDPPHETAVWGQLARLGDPRVDLLAGQLKACCTPTWTATRDLETLLAAAPPWWTRTRPSLGPPVTTAVTPPPAGSLTAWPPPTPRAPRPPESQPSAAPVRKADWWTQQPPSRLPTKRPAGRPPAKLRYGLAVLAALGVWLICWLAITSKFESNAGAIVGAVLALVPAAVMFGLVMSGGSRR